MPDGVSLAVTINYEGFKVEAVLILWGKSWLHCDVQVFLSIFHTLFSLITLLMLLLKANHLVDIRQNTIHELEFWAPLLFLFQLVRVIWICVLHHSEATFQNRLLIFFVQVHLRWGSSSHWRLVLTGRSLKVIDLRSHYLIRRLICISRLMTRGSRAYKLVGITILDNLWSVRAIFVLNVILSGPDLSGVDWRLTPLLINYNWNFSLWRIIIENVLWLWWCYWSNRLLCQLLFLWLKLLLLVCLDLLKSCRETSIWKLVL